MCFLFMVLMILFTITLGLLIQNSRLSVLVFMCVLVLGMISMLVVFLNMGGLILSISIYFYLGGILCVFGLLSFFSFSPFMEKSSLSLFYLHVCVVGLLGFEMNLMPFLTEGSMEFEFLYSTLLFFLSGLVMVLSFFVYTIKFFMKWISLSMRHISF